MWKSVTIIVKPVHSPVLPPGHLPVASLLPHTGFRLPGRKGPSPFGLLKVTLPAWILSALQSPIRSASSPWGAPSVPLLLQCRWRPLPLPINRMPALVSLVARIPSMTPSLLLELPDPILESANLSLKDVPLSTDGQTKRTPLLVPIVPHLQHETESKI